MDNNIIIGKYTLESLTNGMYASAQDLYREYVQNAVDSIDNAIEKGILKAEKSRIDIRIESKDKKIIISDNGCGIGKEYAAKLLLDIGNSTKKKSKNRGFRGIGRLAGLGYCDKLIFETSLYGENKKTIIKFDALRLKELLMISNEGNETALEVMEQISEIKFFQEKEKEHYFKVTLENVTEREGLLNFDDIKAYLIQNLPVRYDDNFKWGSLIESKIRKAGYIIPHYNTFLSEGDNAEELFKPYTNIIISDRIKHIENNIKDIIIKEFSGEDGETNAILWYAQSDFSGTILDEMKKGIRIRQGNIMIGNKTTANQYFKEERFNGWLIGELFIINDYLIPNSRRDDFENTDIYIKLKEEIREWSGDISKEIRKVSYERSVSAERRKNIEKLHTDDDNSLIFEDISFIGEDEEISNGIDESAMVANNELANKFRLFLKQKDGVSKYIALNIKEDITLDQKRYLEKIFDIIYRSYSSEIADGFVNKILQEYN